MSDNCLVIESFPNCSYDQLRDYLILPSKRKLQPVVSSVDEDLVLEKTFNKIQLQQQKNAFVMVDELKIRPTIAFSGGMLSGMAKNNEDCRATSMLCVMMKLLYDGPSVMISVTPVHKLTAAFQFDIVKQAASKVEKACGIVLGSITDNHKINQQYCKLFVQIPGSTATVKHPLTMSSDSNQRIWFLLFDTVHLLKYIRNNWISEKSQLISFDQNSTASFNDVVDLYNDEKDSILKTTPLTQSAVHPSKLQLQNVQHVLKVFNDRVIAALIMKECKDTAYFIQTVVNWWNTVNVSAKGQDKRMNDPFRAVQTSASSTIDEFINIFRNAASGQGDTRIHCLTNDT